jgi:hypothetical protein
MFLKISKKPPALEIALRVGSGQVGSVMSGAIIVKIRQGKE